MAFEKNLSAVLIVDDEIQILTSCDTILRMEHYENIVTCEDSRQVMDLLENYPIGVVLLDLQMPQIPGEKLLEEIARNRPEIPVIVVTGNNTIDSAVQCMKWGAFDYLVKPFDRERLVATVRNAFTLLKLSHENAILKKQLLQRELENPSAFSGIITVNSELLSIFHYLEAITNSSQSVLITGETGVGKELLAHAVHLVSGRKGEFVPVNVAGLDENVFSDTLFGHARGAFTGADHRRTGMVEKAENGTLFLDEIGDLGLNSQVKLLRLLQEREFLPLGVDQPRKTNTRIVLATNCELKARQESGTFRKDLYYRLIAHHVHIPPLRERRDDLPLLVDHFLEQSAHEMGVKKPSWPPDLISLLNTYDFPGNVRELFAMIYRAMSMSRDGRLPLHPFQDHMGGHGIPGRSNDRDSPSPLSSGKSVVFGEQLPAMNEMKGLLIEEALRRSKGIKTVAAEMIGMSRQSLNIHEKRKG